MFGSRLLSLNEVSIVNYGLGNIRSVENGLRAIGAKVAIVSTPEGIESASRLLLPGVGSFYVGMSNLKKNGLDEAICVAARKGTPLLGICLGMQLLASQGGEGGDAQGLGLIPGKVIRLVSDSGFRIPHMGFNEVYQLAASPLFDSIDDCSDFYFVHSYHLVVDNPDDGLASANYSEKFVAAVCRDNVFGTQFHPEKSQGQGLQLLKNFCTLT